MGNFRNLFERLLQQQVWRKVEESNPYVLPHSGIRHRSPAIPAAPSTKNCNLVQQRTFYHSVLLH